MRPVHRVSYSVSSTTLLHTFAFSPCLLEHCRKRSAPHCLVLYAAGGSIPLPRSSSMTVAGEESEPLPSTWRLCSVCRSPVRSGALAHRRSNYRTRPHRWSCCSAHAVDRPHPHLPNQSDHSSCLAAGQTNEPCFRLATARLGVPDAAALGSPGTSMRGRSWAQDVRTLCSCFRSCSHAHAPAHSRSGCGYCGDATHCLLARMRHLRELCYIGCCPSLAARSELP